MFFVLLAILTGCQSTKPSVSLEENQIPVQNEVSKNPNPEALKYFMNGQMLMNQGDFPMAIIEFQEALNLDPNVGTIYTSIAECYWNIGKPELSMKNLRIAISKDPNDEEALKMIADQLIVQKKYKDAIEPLNRLKEINPEETRYIIALAELKKVDRDYSSAMNLYLEAYKIEPSRLELLETAGRYALQLTNKDRASSIFKDLSFKDPAQSNYLNIYLELALQIKKFEEAISHIQ
ncbi:MAG: tetratricopeptide repeat protein, partial [Candidatus Neomarinimicrobiota bacterium]|nr:tetratricopeptide repeat protein [Candidatus Neomarinimicrobiota bacterium]